MAETWPASLPQYPLVDGYDEQERTAYVEFDPDYGPPLRRATTDAPGADIKCRLIMTNTQLNTFQNFWENTISRGSIDVDWINFRTDAAAVYLIKNYKPVFFVGFRSGEALHAVELEMFRY